MNTICNWILNGNGRGKRYLLLLSVIFAMMTSCVVYFSWNNFLKTPQTLQMLRSLPDLKLQNGELTAPADTYKNINWTIADAKGSSLTDFHFIIDTKNNDINTNEIPANTLYLTKGKAYITNNNNLTIKTLKNLPDFEIKQGQMENILQKGNFRFSLALFFTLSLVLFISLYIWSLIYAVFSYLLTLFIPSEKHPFSVRRRLSVASLICAYILILPISFWGFYTGVFIFFITVLLIMSLFLSFLPKNFIISVDK